MHARHLLVTMYQTRQPIIYRDGAYWCGNEKVNRANLTTLESTGKIEPKAAGTSVMYTLTEKGENAAKRGAAQPANKVAASQSPATNGAHRNGGAPTLFDSESAPIIEAMASLERRIVEASAAITHRLDTAIGLLTKIEAHAKSKSLTDTTADAQRRAIIFELGKLVEIWESAPTKEANDAD